MNNLYLLLRSNGIKLFLLASILLTGGLSLEAQVSLTNGSPSVLIDFSNTMPVTVGTNASTAFTGAGFSPNPAAATPGRLNSNAWAFTGWSDGPLGFGGTQTGANDYARGSYNGALALTQGGIYAYVGAPNSVANPALMMQPGGSDFTPGTMTLRIQNNGSSIINRLAISYKIYQRNDQARSQSFNLFYSYDDVTYTQFSPYDYATPTTADGAGWVVGATKSGTDITGLNIPATTMFYLRWTSDDVSGLGSRDEIGIDDISITANYPGACTPPSTNASINSFTNVLGNQMTVNFTRGNGTGGVVAVVSPAALVSGPVSGITYIANSNYGTGAAVSNGFVVYNSNAVLPAPGGTGSFTITGLTPGTTYNINLFESDITVPCYITTGALATQSTAAASAIPSSQFRSNGTTGNWANAFSWDYYNGSSWLAANRIPTTSDVSILVQATHTVDISCPVNVALTSIAGTVTLSTSGVVNLANGTGFDMDVSSGGIFRAQSTTNYTSTFAITAGATINVATGGKITVGNGGSTPGYSPLGYTAGLVTWNDASIFEWNTTDPFITSGSITYFPGAAAGVIPIFRISRSPSLQPGATTNTTWNGVMEVNQPLTLKLDGQKIFRNGIIGTSSITQDDACGQFVINGSTAKLGVSILNLNTTTTAGLDINSNSVTTMTSNVVVNSAGTGVFSLTGSGSLYCDSYVMSGSGVFSLATASTMRLGSPGGISSSGATGNIQTTGSRTFNANTTFIFNGTTNQVTGNGMPTTLTALTIANTGAASNNTVTLTTTLTGTPALTLTSGLFAIGSGQQLNIFTTGTVTATSGDFATGATGGILNFQGTGIFSGNCSPYNVYASGGVNFGVGTVTIQNGGSFRINAGGFAQTNAPFYAAGSSLVYNSGAGYGAGTEWLTTASSGRGIPHHVTILASGTSVNWGASGSVRYMLGNLTINSGTSFILSTNPGGDLLIGGDWTRAATGVFTHNTRSVNFNGAASDQTITVTGGGTETFAFLTISKPVLFPNLKLAGAPNATNINLDGNPASGAPVNTFILTSSSNLDLNQNIFNFTSWNGNQNNIQIDGNTAIGSGTLTRNISSTGGQGVFAIYNTNAAARTVTISRLSASTPTRRALLVFGSTVKITTGAAAGGTGGIDFGNLSGPAAISTVNGILQIDARGFVTGNAPTYGTGSTLIYNTLGAYSRSTEWSTTTGPGYPYNVTVQGASTVLTVNSGSGDANRQIGGTLTVSANAGLILNNSAVAFYITILGDLVLNGSITLPGTLPAYGADIKLAGNWTRSATGTFIPNERAVFFIGSGNSTITANNGEVFPYLYITKTALAQTVTLLDNISVSKILSIGTGTLVLANRDVILQSKDTTASLDKIVAGTSAINYGGTGRFIVERYIPTAAGAAPNHGKSWQFLAVPVNQDNQTVNAAWQEGQAPLVLGTSGRGTIITNSVTGSGGFDIVAGVGGSMKTYVPASGTWNPIAGTGITHYNQKGYMIFVRGDRSVTTYNGTPVATTFRTRGKVMEPTVVNSNTPPTTNIAADVFESIGNPYPSVIDFSNVAGVVKAGNVQNIFYVWDPRLGGGYGFGAWQTMIKGAGTDYTVSPGGGSYGASGTVVNTIQSGQAFLVHTVGGTGTVSFNENAKVTGSGNVLVARPGNPVALSRKLTNQLSIVSGNTTTLIDGVTDEFDRSYSNGFDMLDALKISNVNENLAISCGNKLLAVERKGMIEDGDSIHYNLGQLRVQEYEFEFAPRNIVRQGLKAFLLDRYLHTKTVVSLSDTTRIRFNIENIPGSYAANRFVLVFNERKRVHQLYSILKAEKTNDAILLNWKTGEGNLDGSFELERSADGINYTTIYTETAAGKIIYSWKDLTPLPGSSYYRIHNLDTEGGSYSNLVKIAQPGHDLPVSVFPNPVRNQALGLKFDKLTAGNYVLKLYSNNGQVSWTNKFVYDGVTATKQFKIPALASGIYKLEVISETGTKEILQVFVN